jgi:hypothetical protein
MSVIYRSLRAVAAASLTLGAAQQLGAQATMMPPAMMSVGCETIKQGAGPAHDKHEEAWARAAEAVKGAASTLVLQSSTGPAVSCWLTAVASYDQMSKNNTLFEKDPTYAKLMPSLVGNDGQYISDSKSYIAVLRTDLSAGEMPNVLTRRVTQWDEWRVRFGTEAAFIAALKAYRAAMTRAGFKPEWRTYEVLQGAPSTTFWLFTSQASMAGFDAMMAGDAKIGAAMTPDDQKVFDEASTKSIASRISNIWTYNSAQSTLSAAQRATDDFWKRKAAPKQP